MNRKIDTEELKSIQLDILQAVHDFCVKSNLRYSLAYGTLIGAIRHKGYIPWDDDVDIMMPREDYERFLDTFDGSYNNLIVLAPGKTKQYYAPYANVVNTKTVLIESRLTSDRNLGIKIDVFPVDNVPEDEHERIKLYNKVRTYKHLISIKNARYSDFNSVAGKVAGFFVRIIGHFVSFGNKLDKIAILTNANNKESKMVNNIVWCYKDEKACFLRKDLNEYIDVEFEGHKFKSIVGYDNFLRAHYGNYMQLPPEDQRNPHHGFAAYWND